MAQFHNPTNEQRNIMAHNVKTYLSKNGLTVAGFVEGKNVVRDVVDRMLKQKKCQYREATVAKVASLMGIPADKMYEPDAIAINDTAKKAIKVAAKASAKKEVKVTTHPRKQRVGPKHSQVKQVLVAGHIKKQPIDRASPTRVAGNTKVKAPTIVKADNSVIIGVGKEAIHLPLSRLKNMVTNDDGSLTITLIP